MWKKAQERFRTRSLIATIVLMVIVVIASGLYVYYVRRYTREQTYLKLKSATEETIDSIEGEFRADRNMLRMISRIISSSDVSLRSLSVNTYLNIYQVNSLISDIAILTPENKVIRINGSDLDTTGVLDYNEIKLRGEHISTLQKDLETEGVWDLRSFVPIRKDDETVAYLYGTTTPEDILDAWVPEIYDGHAIISVVERDTGTFLIDGAGRMRQNMTDTDIKFLATSVEPHLAEAIQRGMSGYAIGIEDGQKMYYCFLPMNIENWEMVIRVPEEDVYATVKPIHVSLYIFLFAEAVVLVIYFLYIIHITTGSLVGIERRANMDALTGLQNRNRYEYFCQHFIQGTDGLACIYVDVNGLHDINNTQGHLAGDNMLKTIAQIISNEFGENNTYRIGGDEFVAFRYERDEELVRRDMEKVIKQVEENGYHVACGLAMATPDRKIINVIKSAEEEMYENKRKYYESIGKEMRG